MRWTMLRAARLLCASSLVVAMLGCESKGGGEAYPEGGGNQRVNLPEDAQRQHDGRGVEMNVETGDKGEYEPAPGRQEQSTPQAGASGSGAAPGGVRGRRE